MSDLVIMADKHFQRANGESDEIAGWIGQAARGDRRAFEELVRHYEHKVLSTAFQLLGHPDDAKDAAQEVFLRFYRALKRLDPRRQVAGWLYRVTVNICRDLVSDRRRRSTVFLDSGEVVDQVVAGDLDSDPWRRAAWSAEKALLAKALSQLNDNERQALVLRDLQGLTSQEVADVLGISTTTVRSHICRARLRIKRFRDRRLGEGR